MNVPTLLGTFIGIFAALIIGLNLFEDITETVSSANWYKEVDGFTGIGRYNIQSLSGTGRGGYTNIISNYLDDDNRLIANVVILVHNSNPYYEMGDFLTIGYGSRFEIVAAYSTTGVQGAMLRTQPTYAVIPPDLIATQIIGDTLPVVILIGLLAAGGFIGNIIGRKINIEI